MLEKSGQQLLKMTLLSVPLNLSEKLLAEDEKHKKLEKYEI